MDALYYKNSNAYFMFYPMLFALFLFIKKDGNSNHCFYSKLYLNTPAASRDTPVRIV